MNFLVDECLSQRLAMMARDRGYAESSHVHWLGLGGIQDWNLIHRAVDEDWTLVTKNSYDFRGPAVNQVLEVTADETTITIERYPLPPT